MTSQKKTFDCVEMQHKGGARLARILAGMTFEEKVAYFARGTEELRKRQEELRRKTGWYERQQIPPGTPSE